MWKKVFPFLVIFTTVIFLYYPVFSTYFSQDDFFHFKVSLTNGSASQFINLFGFHSFSERGIAFYRPLFREVLYSSFYSLFGLNPYPFRIFQFLILFINVFLIYYLTFSYFKNKNLSFFVSFFYAMSSAQVSSLYYLAGGIQVLGTTTFMLLTIILFQRNLLLSFITFILALSSHELASIIPILLLARLFITYSFKIALKKLWQVTPFLLTLMAYIYLEVTKIGFSTSEKQYQVVLSLKTAINSYMWYIGWALGLPEMLIDFVLPGFKLNPDLMRYWGGYYQIIFLTFFISIILLLVSIIYIVIKKSRLLINKQLMFFIIWFIISLTPVILLPLHKSTQYLESGLAAFWTIIGFIILGVYKLSQSSTIKLVSLSIKLYLVILIFSLFSLSLFSIILQRATYWATTRGKLAKQLINEVINTYPKLPRGAVIYFKNDPSYPALTKEWGKSSTQASLILNGSDALQLIYNDPKIKVYYEDLEKPNPSQKNVNSLMAKIY